MARTSSVILVLLIAVIASVQAFVTPSNSIAFHHDTTSSSAKYATPFDFATTADSVINVLPSQTLSASTIDPTTILSNLLGGLLTTPAILAVPILAAIALASTIAFFIVSYANPADEDGDDIMD
uniref:Uncharacterized protein n=1 Tax=Ditylum brightwellii TaxID=49249 RepID=A0A6S8X9S4_9STRA|mmetsp:Transcript_13649/g.19895  ORF Transcript_13649/g.19895 Transcript_13649/m.19895 type:complete len:124 (+) Transcript_13649:108-479(+)|eukprot:2614658-Ditylum_brightwellii.AAC.1